MSGFVGLSPQTNKKQEAVALKGPSRSLQTENAGLVAGLAALIVNLTRQKQNPAYAGFCHRVRRDFTRL